MSFLVPPDEAQLERIKNVDVYRPAADLEEDVTQLIEWLSKQPHLPVVTDRKWLLHFITGCKYSLQRAKQVIESYFIARAEYPDYYGSFTDEEQQESNKQGMASFLPKLTPEGYRVLCLKTIPMAEDYKFHVINFFKTVTSLLDLQLKEEPPYGYVVLFDLKHYRMSDFTAFTPTITKNMLECALDSFPLRLKSVHLVNPPMFIGTVVTFTKMFLSNKIKERLFVHESLESLYQFVPQEILPDIFGGFAGSIGKNEENSLELMKSNKEWLDNRPKADLSKRPIHLKSDELDMSGTFKKLDID